MPPSSDSVFGRFIPAGKLGLGQHAAPSSSGTSLFGHFLEVLLRRLLFEECKRDFAEQVSVSFCSTHNITGGVEAASELCLRTSCLDNFKQNYEIVDTDVCVKTSTPA